MSNEKKSLNRGFARVAHVARRELRGLFENDRWAAVTVALAAVVLSFQFAYPGVYPSAWKEFSAALGVHPSDVLLSGLWSAVVSFLSKYVPYVALVAVLRGLGHLAVGLVAFLAYQIFRELATPLLSRRSDAERERRIRIFAAAATTLFVCSETVWSAGQFFSPFTLVLVSLLAAMALALRFLRTAHLGRLAFAFAFFVLACGEILPRELFPDREAFAPDLGMGFRAGVFGILTVLFPFLMTGLFTLSFWLLRLRFPRDVKFLLLVFGVLALTQVGGISTLRFTSWSESSVPSPLLRCLLAFCSATTWMWAFGLLAADGTAEPRGRRLMAIVVRSAVPLAWLVSIPFVPQRTVRKMSGVLDDYVHAVLSDCGDTRFFFTEGPLDAGLALAARDCRRPRPQECPAALARRVLEICDGHAPGRVADPVLRDAFRNVQERLVQTCRRQTPDAAVAAENRKLADKLAACKF